MENKSSRKDLKKYFKRVKICLVCRTIYGTDDLEDSGFCGDCELRERGWKPRTYKSS